MSQPLSASIGSYPRIGEDKDQQRHRRGRSHFDRKEISAHAFRDVEQSVVQEIIQEQTAAGLDQVTDGLIAWQDPVSHFLKNATGVTLGGIARYFELNFYYRVPLLGAKPRVKAPVVAAEYAYAKNVSTKTLRAVVTGPHTLAALSRSEGAAFAKLSSRLSFFTDLIAAEIAALAAENAPIIQVDEPALARRAADFPAYRKVWDALKKAAGPAQLALSLSDAPLAAVYDAALDLAPDALHLDFTWDGPALWKAVVARPPRTLGAGVVNARETRAESPAELAAPINAFRERHPNVPLLVHPSAGLEGLPRDVAAAKIRTTAAVRAELTAPAERGVANG